MGVWGIAAMELTPASTATSTQTSTNLHLHLHYQKQEIGILVMLVSLPRVPSSPH